MKNPITSPAAQSLSLLLARVPLGVYFAVSGYHQIMSTGGVSEFVRSHLSATMQYMPEGVARGYLTAMPFAELLVGALLVFGLFQRIGAFMAAGVLFSIVLTSGVRFTATGSTSTQAIVFLGLSLVLLTVGPGKLSADGLLFGGAKKSSGKPA
jgi:uncharacterized membrane protein YphA (DoxX/SURF4 family)